MARQARVLSPAGLYYIELNGERLYYGLEGRNEFEKIAQECFSDGKVYGIFMSETLIKMVVKVGECGISAAMKSLSIRYARYINKAANTTGKLFSGRFKSEPLYEESEAVKLAESLSDDTEKPVPKPKAQKPKPSKQKSINPEQPAAPAAPEAPAASEAPKPKKKNLPPWLL